MQTEHVVVAGGAGFLGSHLCDRLISDGYRVSCLDNFATGSQDNLIDLLTADGFTLIQCDVSKGLPALESVDYVLNLASPASPIDYLRLPLETLRVGSAGTENLLQLAQSQGARFVMASTSEIYGDPEIHPQPEHYWGRVNPIGPRSVYDEAKRFSEATVAAYWRQYDLDAAIIRIFNTYGPRMRPGDGRAIPTFIRQCLLGEPITIAGDGTQTRSVCYVDDLIEGIVRVMSSQERGPLNIGNPHEVTMLELASYIKQVAGSDSPMIFIDRPEDDPHVRRPDIQQVHSKLGWTPQISFEDGIARTIEWFRNRLA
ncbi:UDP-glucuronic acid decarboxylase family protein [Nocardia farcinica]|uniref:UDP-glucuronic acid decarboxylase family protein n=1 Tax=Nocardia farcinica TaxID=37329 RepID=UPI0024561D0D|nr:SDR family oxidoreductase [Nocardia farcinica]